MKKQQAVDSSGNPIECFTIGKAANYLGIKKEHLKLQLFKQQTIPFYKVMGKSGKRFIRVTKKDLDEFVVDQELYSRIADKIRSARKEVVIIRSGMTQAELAKELKISKVYMNYVENKKTRVGIKTLERIAKILNKDFGWFLT